MEKPVLETKVILFTDIHDYSLVARQLGPSQYEFLQAVYEGLGDVVVAHQGEILNYLGDSLLCMFPAGAELNAVQCALELRQTYMDIVRQKGIHHDTELEIGISSGEVGVGVFGHKSLLKRDAFGEAVNVAAMIGHHRGIALTGDVHDKVKLTYSTRELPALTVKWQEAPVTVWEVVEAV